MWLLDTSRAELHYFTDPAAVPGGYAILSHTWSHNAEQSFQDVRKIIARCKVAGENPREHVLDKIKRCCEITERDGYAWVWIDSCCIDKTSSSELSEAINSMFTWYALSEVCYAYLEDVHFGDDPHAKKSEFKRARWHTRGWTLQELLAPSFVVFLSQEWKPIGTKHDLCGPLQKCTGIYSKYLTRKLNFLEAPIARRMSWAAKRKTTRVEDEAYCLLGLFDINMPTLYGEGQQAFQRLQSELVKQNIDTSLYAWGTWHESSDAELPQGSLSVVRNGFHGPNHTERFLYAPSPKEFRWMDDVYYTPDLPGKVALQPYLKHQGSEDVCVVILSSKEVDLMLLPSPAQEENRSRNRRSLWSGPLRAPDIPSYTLWHEVSFPSCGGRRSHYRRTSVRDDRRAPRPVPPPCPA